MKKLTLTIAAIAIAMTSNVFAANVNTDPAEAIAKDLKGVGIKKAALIVSVRKDGKFKDGKDLAARVKGIGPKTIEKNADSISY
jgi:competence protein ComEA